MKKTITAAFCVFMALACLLTACAGKTTTQKPQSDTKVYKDGMFTDVAADSPYRDYIAAAYELGLMNATGDGTSFGADTDITVAEAVSFADKLHSTYTGDKATFASSEPWYQVYVDYAKKNQIIEGDLENYDSPVCRDQFADIMANAMPASSFPQINTVEDGSIPDIAMDADYADSIYMLYRAGIYTGDKGDGSFGPKENVTRAEVAMVLARMEASSMRGKVTLQAPDVFSPDLEKQALADDDFFKDAAIVGNSLVEGLRLYSKLNTITYYSGTSMSVTSAMKTEIPSLITKKYSRIYIELGINELGDNAEGFKQQYGAMIDTIRKAEPDAEIYIISILPVSKAKNDAGQFTIARVKAYNTALYELATEKECYYIDVYSALVGTDGYLPADETWDGVHLTPDTYSIWENCMRTYYAAEKSK